MRLMMYILALAVAAPACNSNMSGHVEAQGTGDLTYGTPSFGAFDSAQTRSCGAGRSTWVGEEKMVRAPYLQQVTGDSAQILWTSNQPGYVVYRPADVAPELDSIVPAEVDPAATGEDVAQWVADLSALTPGTSYCYQVFGKDDQPWTDWTGFQTAPAAGQPVELTAIGDLGERSQDQFDLLEVMEDLPTQALLVTGDVANPDGTLDDYERNFFDVYQPMLRVIPVYPVSGNHDYNTGSDRPYREVFSLPENGGAADPEDWYSFDWGDAHVVALDTEQMGAEQASWLEDDLAAHADARWTIVMLHRPPYSSGMHGDDADVDQWFVPIFERYHVDLVLAGHDHDYERFRPKNGVVYVVTGGGGRGVRSISPGPDTAYAEDVIHLVHLRITPRTLTGWAIDATGRVFDSFQIAKPAASAAGSQEHGVPFMPVE